MTRSLARMNWPDLKRAVESGARTVILPLGATEQHGPHLPLATDTIRARALAERVADRLEPDVLVAPALPFGCSDEHTGFPGLLGLDAGTLAPLGRIEVGVRADLALLEAPNHLHLSYRAGVPIVRALEV